MQANEPTGGTFLGGPLWGGVACLGCHCRSLLGSLCCAASCELRVLGEGGVDHSCHSSIYSPRKEKKKRMDSTSWFWSRILAGCRGFFFFSFRPSPECSCGCGRLSQQRCVLLLPQLLVLAAAQWRGMGTAWETVRGWSSSSVLQLVGAAESRARAPVNDALRKWDMRSGERVDGGRDGSRESKGQRVRTWPCANQQHLVQKAPGQTN
jgi:hypothetical protein